MVKFTSLRLAQTLSISSLDVNSVKPRETYDLIEPVLSCDDETRFGSGRFNTGDGPKFVCGVNVLKQTDRCLVYSIGSAYDFSFEFAVRKAAPACEIHTFDGTMDLASRPLSPQVSVDGIYFHNWNVVDSCETTRLAVPSRCMKEILKELNHTARVITWLKIDCEGCEFTVMPEILRSVHQIDQVMIEVHGLDVSKVLTIFKFFREFGLEVFHKERNHWGCDGYRCVEFSLMSLQYAKNVLQDFLSGSRGIHLKKPA